MSLTIRRVVTGHDKNGRAVVSIDESVKNVAQARPSAAPREQIAYGRLPFAAARRCYTASVQSPG